MSAKPPALNGAVAKNEPLLHDSNAVPPERPLVHTVDEVANLLPREPANEVTDLRLRPFVIAMANAIIKDMLLEQKGRGT